MTIIDFQARASREAANVIAEVKPNQSLGPLDIITNLVAVAWLKGYSEGSTDTLKLAEQQFQALASNIAAAIDG